MQIRLRYLSTVLVTNGLLLIMACPPLTFARLTCPAPWNSSSPKALVGLETVCLDTSHSSPFFPVDNKASPLWSCLFLPQQQLEKTHANYIYYSFKVFLRFCLAEITHKSSWPATVNQIWKNFAILNRWRQKCRKVAYYWTVNREDLGTSLSRFRSESWRNILLVSGRTIV